MAERKVSARAVVTVMAVGALLLSTVAAGLAGECAEGPAGELLRRGREHFEQALHEHGPRGEAAQMMEHYRLAHEAFLAATAADPACLEAHRSLARVCFLQKDFAGAAAAYRRFIQLDPQDLDAYVALALALIELELPEEAIATLEAARREARDPQTEALLDSYLAKLRAMTGEEGE